MTENHTSALEGGLLHYMSRWLLSGAVHMMALALLFLLLLVYETSFWARLAFWSYGFMILCASPWLHRKIMGRR